MRTTTICLLAVLLGPWTAGFGQSAATENQKNYPQIVAKVHVTGQTAPIPPTAVLVPKKDGLYRVSAYLLATNINGFRPLVFNMTWFDDQGKESSGDMCVQPSTNGVVPVQWITTVRVNANTPLTYSVLPTDMCAPVHTYDVFFTVERLE